LQPDTIVPGAANPQAWNRYSYVLNNPLRYTDPTGHYCVGDDDECADEGGDGPAPTGTGGNNGGGGGGGGGNPHDDDDFDPNPNCVGCETGDAGGGGGRPLLSLDSTILCESLANGTPCVENNFSSGELDYLMGNLYKQGNKEIVWGTSLVVGGLIIGAVVTAVALPALLAGAAVGLALAAGVAGALLVSDGALISNLASQITNVAGSGNTEIALIGSNAVSPTIAVYGDTLSTFTSYSPTGNQMLYQSIMNP